MRRARTPFLARRCRRSGVRPPSRPEWHPHRVRSWERATGDRTGRNRPHGRGGVTTLRHRPMGQRRLHRCRGDAPIPRILVEPRRLDAGRVPRRRRRGRRLVHRRPGRSGSDAHTDAVPGSGHGEPRRHAPSVSDAGRRCDRGRLGPVVVPLCRRRALERARSHRHGPVPGSTRSESAPRRSGRWLDDDRLERSRRGLGRTGPGRRATPRRGPRRRVRRPRRRAPPRHRRRRRIEHRVTGKHPGALRRVGVCRGRAGDRQPDRRRHRAARLPLVGCRVRGGHPRPRAPFLRSGR